MHIRVPFSDTNGHKAPNFGRVKPNHQDKGIREARIPYVRDAKRYYSMFHIHVEFDDHDGAPRRDPLKDFGFDEHFLAAYLSIAEPGETPARVVEVRRGSVKAVTRDRDGGLAEVEAQPTGRLLHEAESQAALPAVGDWVVLKGAVEDIARGVAGVRPIRAVLPRRSAFARRAADSDEERAEAQIIAANVDTAFIVTAAGRDWNPRRVERYTTLAYEAGVEPVLVITKADLATHAEEMRLEAEGLAPGLSVLLVCAPERRGLDDLAPWLKPGKTVVLLGSSGAGKSTLLNALAGETRAATGAVREDDERGRHTTTARELYKLPSGALVIDTPGIREVGLYAASESLAETFADVEKLAALCRFRDCSHGSEPGCAVRAALLTGELDEGRFAGWQKLNREIRYLETRDDARAAAERDAQWKAINRSMRGYSKERRSIQGRSR